MRTWWEEINNWRVKLSSWSWRLWIKIALLSSLWKNRSMGRAIDPGFKVGTIIYPSPFNDWSCLYPIYSHSPILLLLLILCFPFRSIKIILALCNCWTMKAIAKWEEIDQYHAKCICQTCTCHKHRCPKCDVFFILLRSMFHSKKFLHIKMIIIVTLLILGKNHHLKVNLLLN